MARSPYKLPKRGLLARCLCEISSFAPVCAVEMHMDMSQEPFDAKICRKNAASGPVSCEPAQSNAHGHVTRAMLCGNLQGKYRSNDRGHRFCASRATCHKSLFLEKFTRKMPYATTGDIVLCESARSKCTWTCHKSNFVWKFSRKRPYATSRGIYNIYTALNEHRALTPTVRTPQCGHTVWGITACMATIHPKVGTS